MITLHFGYGHPLVTLVELGHGRRGSAQQYTNDSTTIFFKTIIFSAKLLTISLLYNMMVFVKPSYTIITPKQFVLVCKTIYF